MTAPAQRPVPAHSRVRWVSQAQHMYEHPGEWLLLTQPRNYHTARTMVSEINRGRLWAFQPGGDFEAYVNRNAGNAVYARYLGNGGGE